VLGKAVCAFLVVGFWNCRYLCQASSAIQI